MSINCLAHVIQLSANALMDGVKASVKNDALVTTWKKGDAADVEVTISFANTVRKVMSCSL